MGRGTKTAQLGRKASYCLLAGWMLAASAAQGQSSEAETPKAVSVSGELSASYSFKPQFNQGEDDGRGKLYVGAVVARLRDQVSLSYVQMVQTVDSPLSETTILDPRLSVAYLPNLLEGSGLKLSQSIRFIPGVTKESREIYYYGNVRPALTLSKVVGPVTLAAGGSITKHFHRYTLSAAGASNVTHTTTGRVALDVALPLDLSIGAAVERRRSIKFDGPASYSYLNEASLSYAATEKLTLGVGVSTTDAQLDAGGNANNEFDLYRVNKTQMDISASYAL